MTQLETSFVTFASQIKMKDHKVGNSKVGTFLLLFLVEDPVSVLFMPFAIKYGDVEALFLFVQ